MSVECMFSIHPLPDGPPTSPEGLCFSPALHGTLTSTPKLPCGRKSPRARNIASISNGSRPLSAIVSTSSSVCMCGISCEGRTDMLAASHQTACSWYTSVPIHNVCWASRVNNEVHGILQAPTDWLAASQGGI